MVKIQLETGYLEVKEGTVFPLNIGVADIRDLASRSGTFSKTITLVGSKNNHDLLNHYYDVNIVAGSFDINALTKCSVIQNGLPILEDGYLQLLSVNKLQQTQSHEEYIEYEVLVKDAQADFFTKLDNANLEDLDFTDLNHTYTAANVVSSWSNTIADGYVYPMGGSGDNVYPLKEFRPAVYAKLYWDRIHADAGFSYDWSTLSDAYFDKAIIPYNGDQANQDYSDYEVIADTTATIDGYQVAGTNQTFTEQLTSWTEELDAQFIFDAVNGEYDVPFYVTAGEQIGFSITMEYDVNLVNSTGATAYLVDMVSFGFGAYQYRPKVQIYNNGGQLISSGLQFPIDQRTIGSLGTGTTTIGSETITVNIPASNLEPADVLTLYAGIDVAQTGNIRWKDANSNLGNDVVVEVQLDITNIRIDVLPSANIIGSGSTIEVNNFIPRSVKQKDFVKSICQMYNLYVTIDPDNPNKLIYQHRDDFYDSGTEIDWTYKLAKDREQNLQFLPELTSKKLVLSYKQDSDEPNVTFFDAIREVYGQVEFTFDNEYARDTQTKELIFSPTPTGLTPFNAVVPLINGCTPKTNIRILLHNGTANCNPFNVYDYGTTGQTNLTSYPIISHFNDPFNPTFDINFGVCDYYFYDNIVLTNNNLYNLYWRRTIGQINTGKMLTAWFDLREDDIQTIQLNDKIRINNSWWHINKIIDYNANKRDLTKVELMSVDTEINFVDFPDVKPINPVSPVRPVRDIVNTYYNNNNVNLSAGSVTIKGIGNVVIEGVAGEIIGDYRTMEQDGSYVEKSNERRSVKYVSQDYECNEYDDVILAAGTVTITLPPTKSTNGIEIVVKNVGSGVVKVDGNSTEKIDGNLTYLLSPLDAIHLVSYSSNWLII